MNYDGYLSFIRLTFYNGCYEEYGKNTHTHTAFTVISRLCIIHSFIHSFISFSYDWLAVAIRILNYSLHFNLMEWHRMDGNGMESKVEFFDISSTYKECVCVCCEQVYLFGAFFFLTLPDLIIVPEQKSFDRDKRPEYAKRMSRNMMWCLLCEVVAPFGQLEKKN